MGANHDICILSIVGAVVCLDCWAHIREAYPQSGRPLQVRRKDAIQGRTHASLVGEMAESEFDIENT